MGDYSKMTTEDFDRLLQQLINADLDRCTDRAASLLAIPGIYEILAEHYNNDVLEAWDEERKGCTMKGLLAYIFEAKEFGNCSNGGLSSKVKSVIVVGNGIPEIFEARPMVPAVKVVRRMFPDGEHIHFEPVENPRPDCVGWMFGGAYVHSSDSRFGEAFGSCPVPLYDRQETQEENNVQPT